MDAIGATDCYFRWLLTVFFIQATPGWWLSMRFLRPTGWSRSQGQNWWNWRMLKSFWCQIKVKNSDKNWSEYIIFTSFTLRQKRTNVETIMCAARSFCRLQISKNYFWYFMCEKLNFFRKIRFVILTFTNSDIWIFALKIFSSISYSYVYYSHSICSRTQLVNAFN